MAQEMFYHTSQDCLQMQKCSWFLSFNLSYQMHLFCIFGDHLGYFSSISNAILNALLAHFFKKLVAFKIVKGVKGTNMVNKFKKPEIF